AVLTDRIASGRFDDHVPLSAMALHGFVFCGDQCYRAVQTQDNFHQISTHLALTARTTYRISYTVDEIPAPAPIVVTDFIAPGYDNPEQERSTQLGPGQLYRPVLATWNSQNAPPAAIVRLFYSGHSGLTVRAVRVATVSGAAL